MDQAFLRSENTSRLKKHLEFVFIKLCALTLNQTAECTGLEGNAFYFSNLNLFLSKFTLRAYQSLRW